MLSRITLADLGTGDLPVRVTAWFVEPGDRVEMGDRIAEVTTTGITCDVASSLAGRLVKYETEIDAKVATGDTLAWVETDQTMWRST